MKLLALCRTLLAVTGLGMASVILAGCSGQEDAKPPSNSSYYSGALAVKPKDAMMPKGPPQIPMRKGSAAGGSQ
jgi:hypothetical protein